MRERFKRLSPAARGMCKYILLSAAMIIAAGAALYTYWGDYIKILWFALGVSLTSALNLLKVFWLEQTVNKSLSMESPAGENYVRMQFLLRNFLTLAVLVAAALSHPYINLVGAVLGIFTFKIATFSLRNVKD
jgi:uncharacterized protein (DUF58 family)